VFDGDELAGVASQFGALSRAGLVRAAEELAFKRGETVETTEIEGAVDDALADLRLVAVEGEDTGGGTGDGNGGGELLAPGPTAFPRLPDGADDLPHILDAPERSVPREDLVEPAERRLRAAAATAVAEEDRERMGRLLDATYDLESWGPDADVASVRERLDAALAEGEVEDGDERGDATGGDVDGHASDD